MRQAVNHDTPTAQYARVGHLLRGVVPRSRFDFTAKRVGAPDEYEKRDWAFRGANRDFFSCNDRETMLSGPAETGKTITSLARLDALARRHKGLQGVIVRKVRADMPGSVLQTFERKVLGTERANAMKYGGENPEFYQYPNGSRVWVAGIDRPGKALSSERDIAYVNQAEELDIGDWETLTTRCTGRAANAPVAQVMGDCNPGPPDHWIQARKDAGALTFFESRHEDNPTLFDDAGEITERGMQTMTVLDNLTGVRYWRLRKGLWIAAEGVVYEGFDPAIHVIPAFEIPEDWRRFRVVDFGYTNPFVTQFWAIDPDGRMYLYRQIYRTQRTVRAHAEQINELSKGERIETTVCDHDAEDRATMHENGIPTVAAYKAISPGLQAVEERLKVQGDGRPRIYFLEGNLVERDESLTNGARPRPASTEQEFPVYVWPKGADGKAKKEVPVKEHDHGMDAMRYGVCYADGMGEREVEADIIMISTSGVWGN